MSSAIPEGRSRLRVYRDASSLEELRGFWSSRHTEPAGNLDFFLTVICASPVFVRPHVIVLFKDNEPQSLLLGRLERRSIDVRLGYLRVPTPKLNILTVDDCGWLTGVSAADSELFVRHILACLRSGEADAADLQHLDTAHPLYKLARSLPGRFSSDYVPHLQILRMRKLSRDRPFLQSLSATWRDNQRRRARRLASAFGGKARVEYFRDANQVSQLMQDAETVAKTSYQRGLGVGFVHDDTMHRRLILAAQHGILRGHVLYVDTKPCAFWITSLHDGVLYSEFTAYDPAFAKYGVGLYLIIKVIEEVSGDDSQPPTTVVNFGIGDADWKAHLSNYEWELASLCIFAPTLKGGLVNLLKTLAAVGNRSGKTVLQRAGLLARLKRRWRRLFAPKK
jgi:hypothetical protein